MKKVLWLVSWYPNRKDQFDGDFIQRHARAVSRFCNVHVIFVTKDASAINNAEAVISITGNLTEQVIYYPSLKTGSKLLDRFLSHRKYIQHYKNAITAYIDKDGKPDYVHVHVALQAGLAALWIKKKWEIPFIVSEHWTGYLEEAGVHFSAGYRRMAQRVLREARIITVVSDHLGRSMQKIFPFIAYKVVPNVVDTGIFFPVSRQASDKLCLIHASNMNYQKNCEAILKALQLVKATVPAFEMQLYGPVRPLLQDMVINLGLQDNVLFKGEVPQPILAKAMQEADALVLYSRFETFGCVLVEANACGLPVIVSDLDVFHELVTAGVNGIFVKGDDPQALAREIIGFVKKKANFKGKQIAETTALKYNYDQVGSQYLKIYENI